MEKLSNKNWHITNIKALLIFLVVFAHILVRLRGMGQVQEYIRVFVYFFHMPAFLFVSGFLSKKVEKIRDNAVCSRLIPYFLIVLVICLSEFLFQGKAFNLRVLNPPVTTWYFLVLFIYATFLKDIVKIKFIFPISIIVAIGVGIIGQIDTYLSLSKAFVFLPFYLAGYYCQTEHLDKIKKAPKWISAGIIALCVGATYLIMKTDINVMNFLSQKGSYHSMKAGNKEGMLIRMGCILIAFLMIFVIINLVPVAKNRLSYIGDNTMVIYTFHLASLRALDMLGVFKVKGIYSMIICVLVTIVLILLLGMPGLNKKYTDFIQWIYQCHLDKTVKIISAHN